MGQIALHSGMNDFDGTVPGANQVTVPGAALVNLVGELERIIRAVNYPPCRRDTRYQAVQRVMRPTPVEPCGRD